MSHTAISIISVTLIGIAIISIVAIFMSWYLIIKVMNTLDKRDPGTAKREAEKRERTKQEVIAAQREKISTIVSETLTDYTTVMISPETLLYRPVILNTSDPNTIAGEKAIALLRDIEDKARTTTQLDDLKTLHTQALSHVQTWERALRYADGVGIPILDPKLQSRATAHLSVILDEKATISERDLHLDRLTVILNDVRTTFHSGFDEVAQETYLSAISFAKEHGEISWHTPLELEH